MHIPKTIRTITFDGGCFCFDLINTVSSRVEEPSREYLHAYTDVLILTERQDILPQQMVDRLREYAQNHVGEAKQALIDILTIRENLYQLFSAIASGSAIPEQVLAKFNSDLAMVYSHLEFQSDNNNLKLNWRMEETDLLLPLRMALKSGYDVLTGQEAKRIKECSGCGWLFLDQSKNNARRWCDMQVCGSHGKSRRYYQRKKQKT